MNPEDLKKAVKEKYDEIVRLSGSEQASCCDSACCCGDNNFTFSENYGVRSGYVADADLGLGCGIPTDYAGIKPGDHVLDLGSGAGNDCFVARALVGETGRVTGIDFTDSMIDKARENCRKLGYENVEFVKGDIENMPFESDSFDVVISNCVLNLVPDKHKAFREIFRVLKPGGHFCVSDIVLKGTLPDELKNNAELYTGCIAGAVSIYEYTEIIKKAGFRDIKIHKEKKIELPFNIECGNNNGSQTTNFTDEKAGIFSVTISATKDVY